MRGIVDPVISGMAAEGHPFQGFLYVGLMLTSSGPQVIEFNVRLGDPEAQVILPAMVDSFAPLLAAAAAGELRSSECTLSAERHVGVVLASRGYPGSAESGRPIQGIESAERLDVTVLHGGTAIVNRQLVTAGGRVLTVVGHGKTFSAAAAHAYEGVAQVFFEGMQFRRDIG